MTGVALVVGAGQGIGAGIAEQLSREGYELVLVDLYDPEETVRTVIAAGGTAQGRSCDVRDWGALSAIVDDVEKAQGPIVAAVQDTGIWESVPFLELDPGSWRTLLGVNLDGGFNIVRLAAESMARRVDYCRCSSRLCV